MTPTERTFIAIDPGGAGAIAWSNRHGQFALPMPETRGDTIMLIKRILNDAVRPVAYTEKVAPYIPGGGPSAMFTYGGNVERPQCILETLGCPIVEITPQKWQKLLNLGNSERISPPRMPPRLSREAKKKWKSDHFDELERAAKHNDAAKREWKKRLKEEAARRFPEINVTAKNCDALLLLDAVIIIEGAVLTLI
jgi:hypothetical protein